MSDDFEVVRRQAQLLAQQLQSAQAVALETARQAARSDLGRWKSEISHQVGREQVSASAYRRKYEGVALSSDRLSFFNRSPVNHGWALDSDAIWDDRATYEEYARELGRLLGQPFFVCAHVSHSDAGNTSFIVDVSWR